jgi:hypothetical protein
MPTLIINKNSLNYVYPTCSEKTTLSPVYYLLEIRNDETKEKVYCIPTELSTELQRYNKWLITESASPIPLMGEVLLSEGKHTYVIYEQSNSTNLNPSGLAEVENGILKCVDNSNNLNTEYPDGVETNTIYE